jgi:RNA polymerase sigma factor (sigma-70 family)
VISTILSDSEFLVLLQRIKNRDDGAMCKLIEYYGGAMERLAEKLIGPALQSHLDPADAVQTVQLTLWVGIRTGQFVVPSPSHLLALTKTLLRRHIARYWRKVKSEMASTLSSSMIETVVERDLSAALREAEQHRKLDVDEFLEQFLTQIDEIDQQLVKMRFHGYTTAEAAENLQLDPGFLRVRLSRLRIKFANLWPLLESKA